MTLLLGPVLRHVSDTTALVWVQTESAATVEVLGCSARTFAVQGHHYALVGAARRDRGHPDRRILAKMHRVHFLLQA